MPEDNSPVEVYQLRIYLREMGQSPHCVISPAIWRRLLVRSDSTIADLHYTLQIAMGWSDFHLHQFVVRGKRYGISRLACTGFHDDPRQVRLDTFHFRLRERFLYEYDFSDLWQHEIRLDPRKTYPLCIGGARKAPPEDCGGPWAFMALKQQYSVWTIAEQLAEMLEDGTIEERYEELFTFRYWWNAERFGRRAVNRCLKQYASGDEAWMWA